MELPFDDISGQTFRRGRYQLLDILGSGSFAITYRAIDRSITSRVVYVAVKVQLRLKPGSVREESLLNEVMVMMKAGRHDNVIRFRDFVQDDTYSYIVMDLCCGCDLQACIDAGYFVKNDNLVKIVYCQILAGIRHLHRLGIYHYDLKPQNIMVSPDWKVTIIDFGLASTEVDVWVCGTRSYRPPETFIRGNTMNGRASDIWALGVVLVVMIAKNPLWYAAMYDDPLFIQYIFRRAQGVADFCNVLHVTPSIGLLLLQMLEPILGYRPSIEKIMKDFVEAPNVFDKSNSTEVMRKPVETNTVVNTTKIRG